MDLYKAIRSLYEEKKRLDRLIQSLEKIQARAAAAELEKPRSRRGRRGMSADERKQVSERMKRYWAGRRAQPAATADAAPEPPERTAAVPAATPAATPAAAAAAAGAAGAGAASSGIAAPAAHEGSVTEAQS